MSSFGHLLVASGECMAISNHATWDKWDPIAKK